MKKMIRNSVAALLGVLMCVTLLVPAVLAGTEKPSVALEVEVTVTGDKPSADELETFCFVLRATDESYPMPEATLAAVEGEGTVVFDEIVFDTVGIYTYTVEQLKGDNDDYTYDDSVYTVVITIVNDEVNGGLDAVVAVHASDDMEHKYELKYENRFEDDWLPIIPPPETEPDETEPPETKPVETEPPETRPVETEALETEPARETEPDETEPPETEPDETEPAEIEPEPETEVQEPVEELVQTGQLNWPISVLSVSGIGFLAVGCVFLSGSKPKKDRE